MPMFRLKFTYGDGAKTPTAKHIAESNLSKQNFVGRLVYGEAYVEYDLGKTHNWRTD